jgi:hypothetical protein
MCLELNEVSMSINELCLTTQVLLRLPGVLISTRNNVIVLMGKKILNVVSDLAIEVHVNGR